MKLKMKKIIRLIKKVKKKGMSMMMGHPIVLLIIILEVQHAILYLQINKLQKN